MQQQCDHMLQPGVCHGCSVRMYRLWLSQCCYLWWGSPVPVVLPTSLRAATAAAGVAAAGASAAGAGTAAAGASVAAAGAAPRRALAALYLSWLLVMPLL